MKLRTIASVLIGILSLLALGSSIALVMTTTILHDVSLQLLDTNNSIVTALELETNDSRSCIGLVHGEKHC